MENVQPQEFDVIIVGASTAGTIAAERAAMNPLVKKVTVISDNGMSSGPDDQFVPQSRHTHITLAKGVEILEATYPNFVNLMQHYKVPRVDWGRNMQIVFRNGASSTENPLGFHTYTATRSLIDYVIQQETAKNPKITFVKGKVDNLLWSEDRSRVIGVHCEDGSTFHAHASNLCNGMTSKWPEWFRQAGYSVSERLKLYNDAECTYLTFDVDAADLGILVLLGYAETVQFPYGMIITELEGNKGYKVTVVSYGGPLTLDTKKLIQFLSFYGPTLAKALRNAKPQTAKASQYNALFNQLWQVEKMERWPKGIVVSADALARFNPHHGQGQTIAIDEGRRFGLLIGQQDWEKKYIREVSQMLKVPWLFASGGDQVHIDYRSGQKKVSAAQKYFNRLQLLGGISPLLQGEFFKVQNFKAGPKALFTPQVISEVWRTRRYQFKDEAAAKLIVQMHDLLNA